MWASADLGTTEARRVLLRVLAALADHRAALVLIGAQAVLERTRSLEWLPPTSTTDADLCLDPSLLAAAPLISESLAAAGFHLNHPDRPGIYAVDVNVPGLTKQPTLDLLVPEMVAGKGTRSASIGAHGKRTATRAKGIEMALLDHSAIDLRPLDGDGSSDMGFSIGVAGVAALLCAKSYKLAERVEAFERGRGRPERIRPKDAGDVLRLMVVSDPAVVRETFTRCEADPLLGQSVAAGRGHLLSLFTSGGVGVDLAIRSASNEVSSSEVSALMATWMSGFNQL
jgi:hypothetical protein